jgi:hypothetical protein
MSTKKSRVPSVYGAAWRLEWGAAEARAANAAMVTCENFMLKRYYDREIIERDKAMVESVEIG